MFAVGALRRLASRRALALRQSSEDGSDVFELPALPDGRCVTAAICLADADSVSSDRLVSFGDRPE